MANLLSQDQRAILEAMMRLGGGNTPVEIAAKAQMPPPVVGRLLREMEAGLNPRPVQETVDEGRGTAVWFATPSAEEYLSQ
jgi:hypothetical protein